MKRAYLSNTENKIAGVCGGFAESLGIDPTWIRLFFVAAVFSPLPVIIFYILCWVIVPRAPEYEHTLR
jgi:phage shock protein PspC (stress-responsive transcriptional regulator)